jgi:hypothetical protein
MHERGIPGCHHLGLTALLYSLNWDKMIIYFSLLFVPSDISCGEYPPFRGITWGSGIARREGEWFYSSIKFGRKTKDLVNK